VDRFLDSRPILARAPSTIDQFRKFAKRNRALVTGVVMTLVALVAGIVATTTFGWREATQRRAAEKARQDAQDLATFQEDMLSGVDAPVMGRRLADDVAARIEAARHEAGASGAAATAASASFRALLTGVNTTDAALAVIDQNILDRAIATAQTQFGDRS